MVDQAVTVNICHNVLTSARHLLARVNDILDIAKIETNKLKPDLEDVNLNSVAAEAVRELSVQIDNKRLKFEGVEVKYGETIYSDMHEVRQILVNLLSNAMKFTPEGGRIGVSIAPSEGSFVDISIWDTRVGIAKDEIEKVLTPSGQTGDINLVRESGTSFGVAIVKALAELHGGRSSLKVLSARAHVCMSICEP
jgi:signal transduction histidine kinase